MDFFDKLSDIITTTGRDVKDKAKDLTEVVRLNSQITAEESKRRETLTLLGQMFFEKIKDNPPEDYADIAAVINKTIEDESALRERLRILKGVVKCSGCGKDIPVENAFCSFCGAKNELKPKDECCTCTCEDDHEDCEECACGCQNEEAEADECSCETAEPECECSCCEENAHEEKTEE